MIRRTVEACELAREAAAIAAEGIATGSLSRLNGIRQCEKDLDAIDAEIDSGVTTLITQVQEDDARQLLACMKLMIGLERIGDLLLSFSSSAQAAANRLDSEDSRDLTQMATLLEKMLSDVGRSFSQRDVKKAVDVLQVIFMTQSLERAGDHAKNIAEEVCYFVSGHSVRHLLMAYDKPFEQMFIEWLRQKEDK